MSYKSKAQRDRIMKLHREGKISTEKVMEYESKAPKDLPERVEPKKRDPNKWPAKQRWPRRK